MKFLAVFLMVEDSKIPSLQLHISLLPLSGVPEDAIWLIAIGISISMTRLTGEKKDERKPRRCANSALPLAAVGLVE